jgi:hypothetical protein
MLGVVEVKLEEMDEGVVIGEVVEKVVGDMGHLHLLMVVITRVWVRTMMMVRVVVLILMIGPGDFIQRRAVLIC